MQWSCPKKARMWEKAPKMDRQTHRDKVLEMWRRVEKEHNPKSLRCRGKMWD